MAKETKSIITLEDCKNRALSSIKLKIRPYLISLAMAVILFIPFYGLVGIAFGEHWALGAFTLFSVFIPHILLISVIAYYVGIYKRVQRGEISVVVDKVVRFGEEFRRYRRFANVIYFRDYGKYVQEESLSLTSHGDEFYVVILNGKRKRIYAAYNMKIYEYK